jgi:hypothetical protein
VLWRTDSPVWQSIVEVKEEREMPRPLGIIHHNGLLHMYWGQSDSIIVATIQSLFTEVPTDTAKLLRRSSKNPILVPHGERDWEWEGTFNPGAFVHPDGSVHPCTERLGKTGFLVSVLPQARMALISKKCFLIRYSNRHMDMECLMQKKFQGLSDIILLSIHQVVDGEEPRIRALFLLMIKYI